MENSNDCSSPKPEESAHPESASSSGNDSEADAKPASTPREIGGRDGPEPTRYGDWEKNGRCIDF